MNVDLTDNWIEMSLMPVIVDNGWIDQYVAYLLGDEMASDAGFAELMGHVRVLASGRGCRFSFNGSCFHPFRPYSLVEGIFSASVGRLSEAFTNEGVEDALRNRRCDGLCHLGYASHSSDSALFGIGKLYREVFDTLASEYGCFARFAVFKDRWNCLVDGAKLDLGDLQKYEDNVRAHFWRLFERHYGIASNACRDGLGECAGDSQSDRRSRVYRADMQIRFELVTHCQTYWKAGKYKEHES